MTKTLILGGTGQVGTQMCEVLAAGGDARNLLGTSRSFREGWLQMDLAELSHVCEVAKHLDPYELNAIYCTGGMTNVDACEGAPDLAERTNARGPGVLAAYANSRNIPYVYFSTEYVFDGFVEHPGPYEEADPTHPLSVYGTSKLHGERAVMDACPGALVLRTTVVYGPDSRRKNYVHSLMHNLARQVPMRVPEDQISTPTYNRDLISVALGLVAEKALGIFHVCGPEVMGRLVFAQRVAAALGLDGSLLEGVSTAMLAQTAPRPLYAGLKNSKLERLYPHLRMRTLAESLDDCRVELMGVLDQELAGR